MLLSQKAIQDQSDVSPGSPSKAPGHSPVKGVMAAISKHRVSQEPLHPLSKQGKKIEGLDIPHKIEDVPFRRQDLRILNGRKKRHVAKKVICFGITTAIILLGLGIGLLVLYFLYKDGSIRFWIKSVTKTTVSKLNLPLKLFSRTFFLILNLIGWIQLIIGHETLS